MARRIDSGSVGQAATILAEAANGYQCLRRSFWISAVIRFLAALDSNGHAAITAASSESVESASENASSFSEALFPPAFSDGVRGLCRPFPSSRCPEKQWLSWIFDLRTDRPVGFLLNIAASSFVSVCVTFSKCTSMTCR